MLSALFAVLATTTTKLSLIQVVVLALLQGVAELFPISSLGHTVIAPKLLGWHIDQKSDTFLPFVVALHLGTGLALVFYFRRDWVAIITPMVRSVQRGSLGSEPEGRIGWLICAGTVPAAILGVLFEKSVRALFADPKIAAGFLLLNGCVLFLGERLRLRAGRLELAADLSRAPRSLATLTWRQAIGIGASQALAFLPGISRSGSTMVAGLVAGLSHEAAARFSFLLATPVILAAAVLELPALFDKSGRDLLGYAILGAVLAGIAAYASVRFLMRYFTTHRLTPFAYYCWAAGIVALIGLSLRG